MSTHEYDEHGAHGEDPPYDEDLAYGYERTFPALPPSGTGRGFAGTWWGRAWLRALEDSALDGEQLRQGRRLARSGAVGAVSVRPGRLTAVVRDRDGTAHRTDLLLQEFGEADWGRVLDLAAAESGHIAALLEREVPPELAEDAAAAGVELLPGIGGLDPDCDCGEWDHCPHTAALAYQVARLLDQDPFVLLLLRGRGERAVLDALERRSAAAAAGPGAQEGGCAVTGAPAAQVFAARGAVAPLPPLPRLPAAPGHPPQSEGEEEPELDLDAVEFIAQATAVEAHRMLARALSPGAAPAPAALTLDQDAVRLAASEGAPVRVRARLAAASGRDRAALDLAVRAWGFGGAPALAVLEEDWAPDRAALGRARAALAAAWPDEEAPVLRRVRARWTPTAYPDRQLRLGREGLWWPYRKEAGRWLPAGPPARDPASALAVPGPGDAAQDS
ncbi:SWF or SNF family helicase [Streptomyces sp. NPDC051555]|uniref:SWF or SNF family helicase n=1 Tax=Streptomyces sp. NPDC051555 TaxID=3365657 RepID=UPI0037A330C4